VVERVKAKFSPASLLGQKCSMDCYVGLTDELLEK